MLKIKLPTLIILLFTQSVLSQVPEDYYLPAEGLTGTELKTALHDIIDAHQEQSYDDLWNILIESDADTTDADEFILLYTGRELSATAEYPDWNREHVWSKSHGDFGNTPPAGTDAHHIRPADVSVNSSRGNLDFDNGGNPHSEATECYYDSDSWEPRDAVKGDVARMMFYMAVRYEGDEGNEPDLELKDEIPTSGPWFGKLSTLLEWNEQDPVDDFERNRNNVVYSYQNNRNPFVDHPEYVQKIWGEEITNTPPVISNIQIHPAYPTDQDTVNISATISDEIGNITKAEVCWGLSASSLQDTIPMEPDGDTYLTKAGIPAHEDSTDIFYQVVSEDDSADVTKSPVKQYMVNNAATTIVNENFTSCPPDNWTNFSVSGSNDWECNSGGYMEVNAYNGDNPSSDWLILPEYNPALFDEEALTFFSWTKYYDEQFPQLTVKYSTDYTDGEDPRTATWEVLNYIYPEEDSETWTSSGMVDLSIINSGQAHLAFHYTSSGTGGGSSTLWKIDSVKIIGTLATNESPKIANVTRDPSEPTEADTVKIKANITDDRGINAAWVKWNVEGALDSVKMEAEGNLFAGFIPPVPENKEVTYYLTATDFTGVTVSSNEYSYTPTDAITVPQFDTVWFEPENPENTETLTVYAHIISDVPLKNTSLSWGESSGFYTDSTSMTLSDTLWKGEIEPASGADSVCFQVRSINNWDSSATSNEFRVEYTAQTQVSHHQAFLDKFVVYPNPVKKYLKVQSCFSNAAEIQLSLYDLQGNKIYTRKLTFKPNQTHSINLTGIPRGTYLLRLSGQEIFLNKKLVVW
jgi:endonuclease I